MVLAFSSFVAPAFGGFGTSSSSFASSSSLDGTLFGNTQASLGGFGATTSSFGFGGAAAAPAATSSFGSFALPSLSGTGGLFGAPSSSSTGFGSTAFGAPAANTGSGFSFGGFGAASSTSLGSFAAAPAAQSTSWGNFSLGSTATTGSLFGGSTAGAFSSSTGSSLGGLGTWGTGSSSSAPSFSFGGSGSPFGSSGLGTSTLSFAPPGASAPFSFSTSGFGADTSSSLAPFASTNSTGFGSGFGGMGSTLGLGGGTPLGATTIGVAGSSPYSPAVVDSDPHGVERWPKALGLSQSEALQSNNRPVPAVLKTTPRSAVRIKPKHYPISMPQVNEFSVLSDASGPQLLNNDIVLVSRRNLRSIRNLGVPDEVPIQDEDSAASESPSQPPAQSSPLAGAGQPHYQSPPSHSSAHGLSGPRSQSPIAGRDQPQLLRGQSSHAAANGAASTNGVRPRTRSPLTMPHNDSIEDALPGIPVLTRKKTPFPGIAPTLDGGCDYSLSPPIDVLERMSKDDLRRVKDFAIACDYGRVQWLEPVDLHDFEHDLSEVVCFGERELEVYPDPRVRPPVGQRLNKPAQIELFNVWPKNQKKFSRDVAMVKHYEDQLRAAPGEFVSYDANRGIWAFRVSNFEA